MTRTFIAAVLAFASLAILHSPTAHARRRGGPAPACGYRSLPFAVGNTWTYTSGPESVVIKVTDISQGKDETGKEATLITTEEQYKGRTVKAVHSCTPGGGMVLSLDSFFFSGEPGGGVGLTFTVTSRDKVSFLNEDQMLPGNGWVEVVKADVTRTDGDSAGAHHLPGKVEVERHVSVAGNEAVMLPAGRFLTQKIDFELRGRAFVGDEKFEIPIKRPGEVWLAKGIGVVKMQDAFAKTWELADSNLMPK